LFALAILSPLAFVLLPCCTAAQEPERLPAEAKLARIEVEPATIVLKNPYEYRQLLLVAQLESGERIDLTRMARAVAPNLLVSVSPRGLVRPKADGEGEVKFTVAGQTVTVPVRVSGQKEKYEASFVRDIMPVLSRVGCSARQEWLQTVAAWL
jgi:hypothetical protein